jgi:hypothetical protein
MVISAPLIACALTLFVALGIIFIGIRERFQPSVAARLDRNRFKAVKPVSL